MARIRVWVCKFADRQALQLQWMDPTSGRRKTKSARTADPTEAENRRADLEYELSHGLHSEPDRITWQAFRQAFDREYVAPLRLNTRRGYNASLNQLEEDMAPGLLSGITQRTVSSWVAVLRQRLQPSSIVIRLEHLHTALKWAVEQDLLPKVPKFPRVDVPERSPQPVPEELFDRLLAAADEADGVGSSGGQVGVKCGPFGGEMRAYLLCAWLAGMRRSEAADLRWEASEEWPWLDFQGRRVWFPATYAKGRRDQWVPLDSRLQTALEELRDRTQEKSGIPDGSAENGGNYARNYACADAGRVFHGHPRTWSERVQLLAARAGVRLTMRALRRGFVCRYAGKVPAQVLRQLARHASLDTTLSYYAAIDRAVEEAVHGAETPLVTPPAPNQQGTTAPPISP